MFEFVFKMVSRNKNVHLLDAHVYISLLRSNIRVSLIRVFIMNSWSSWIHDTLSSNISRLCDLLHCVSTPFFDGSLVRIWFNLTSIDQANPN